MFKRLVRWLTKGDRPPRPPLLTEESRRRAGPPPPPPPPGRSAEEITPAEERPQIPAAKRGLRLIQGDAQDPPDPLASEMPPAPEPTEGPEEHDGEPKVKLVFSDGSTTRLATSQGAGVRIRYLAENILPPDGDLEGS